MNETAQYMPVYPIQIQRHSILGGMDHQTTWPMLVEVMYRHQPIQYRIDNFEGFVIVRH